METKKRSQVTVFIIIGLILLFTFAFVFYAAKQNIIQIDRIMATPGFEVRNYVQDCLELVSDEALGAVLAQGGNYETGGAFESAKVYKLAKPIDKNGPPGIQKNYEFSSGSIATGIETYFDDVFLDGCIQNFDDFPQTTEFDKPELDVEVGDSLLIFNLFFPIIVYDGEDAINLERFTYKKNIKIGEMIDFVNKVVDSSIELNEFPEDTLKGLIDDYDLARPRKAKITILQQEVAKGPYETYGNEPREFEDFAYYFVLDDNFPLAFGIQYDWIGR
ncbi:hypothetical protein HYU09_01250 [Candidatus Woesearchaeota archaeon]|nr:hypothetical protein [Candidatus Woesearchaeota archaeon]